MYLKQAILIAFGTCNCLLGFMKRKVDIAYYTMIKADYHGMHYVFCCPLASVRDGFRPTVMEKFPSHDKMSFDSIYNKQISVIHWQWRISTTESSGSLCFCFLDLFFKSRLLNHQIHHLVIYTHWFGVLLYMTGMGKSCVTKCGDGYHV